MLGASRQAELSTCNVGSVPGRVGLSYRKSVSVGSDALISLTVCWRLGVVARLRASEHLKISLSALLLFLGGIVEQRGSIHSLVCLSRHSPQRTCRRAIAFTVDAPNVPLMPCEHVRPSTRERTKQRTLAVTCGNVFDTGSTGLTRDLSLIRPPPLPPRNPSNVSRLFSCALHPGMMQISSACPATRSSRFAATCVLALSRSFKEWE